MGATGKSIEYLRDVPIDEIRKDVVRGTGRDIFLEEENTYWKDVDKILRRALR